MTWYDIAKGIVRPVSGLLYDVKVSGTDNVPSNGPLIVACNHVSYLDPPILGSWFPRTVHFMAKQELFSLPIFGPVLNAINAFPVNREAGDLGAIRHALRVLKNGGVVGIFPEGRRNIDGEAQARSGAVLLAATEHCPVIPVALVGTQHAAKRLRASHVSVRIGAPMTFQGSSRKPTKLELAEWTGVLARRIAELAENHANTHSQDPGILLRR